MAQEVDPLKATHIIAIGKHCIIVTWMNVCIAVWRDETRVSDVVRVSDALDELSKKQPGGVGLMQFVDEGCVGPSADARVALGKLLNRGRAYIRCSVVTYVGDGFRAAAIRAVITAVYWLARPGFPHQVFVDPSAAASALASYLAPKEGQAKWARALRETVYAARRLADEGGVAPGRPIREPAALSQ